MGQGGIHCPLCDCYVFSDVAKYVSALSNLLVCPLTCPLPGCGHAVVGVAGLAEHVASHGPQHQTADNIDQVIRDIEELVDRESNTKVDNILEQSETSNHSMSSSFVFPNPTEESQTSENANKLLESDLFDTAYRAPDPGHSNMSANETHNYHWGQMIPAIATVKGSNTKAPAYGTNQPPHSINYQSSSARGQEGQLIFPTLYLHPEHSPPSWERFSSPTSEPVSPNPPPYSLHQPQQTKLYHTPISCSKLPLSDPCPEEPCLLPEYRQETENINQLSNTHIPLQSPAVTSKPRDPRSTNPSSPFVSQLKVTGPSLHTKSVPYKKPQTPLKSLGGRTSSTGSEVECNQCGWMFDNASFLQLHKVLMHSRRKEMKTMTLPDHYTCKQCPNDKTIFQQYDLYTEHLCKVHNDYRHVCKFCSKLFKLKGSLLVHQRVMHQPINARVTNLLAKRTEDLAADIDLDDMDIKTEVGEDMFDNSEANLSPNSEILDNHTKLKQEPYKTSQDTLDLEKGEIVVDESKEKMSPVSPTSEDLQCKTCSKGSQHRYIIIQF